MTTLMLLLARHDGQEEIPFRIVARDYFGLEPEALDRKIKKGTIPLDLPATRLKTIRSCGVPLTCLARYIQRRRDDAKVTLEEYVTDTALRNTAH
ncbi:pyocin activator PrtN family protein [Aliiroseovarius sp. M344]|uniref:pyocin activator PrtN family protein n=1 Tax=Aliiroseovarius sp. M344 TaxID=2867010 RepID=UPI0021ADAEC2|nr:pyocin activator PrtN family protein [Aliiroseovarius sp. M344]UWQ13083.1 pyocin activator PrtN family protein [Aliiroseovarius sp. M344]